MVLWEARRKLMLTRFPPRKQNVSFTFNSHLLPALVFRNVKVENVHDVCDSKAVKSFSVAQFRSFRSHTAERTAMNVRQKVSVTFK